MAPGEELAKITDKDGDLPPWCWVAPGGDLHREAEAGRSLYWIGDDALTFGGHGAATCVGCGVGIDPDPVSGCRLPACPLCGASQAVSA